MLVLIVSLLLQSIVTAIACSSSIVATYPELSRSASPINGVAASITQNSNPSNEDALLVVEVENATTREKISVYAVFDGHSGAGTSGYLAANFQTKLQDVLNHQTGGDIEAALRRALKEIDAEYTEKRRDEAMRMGSCALVIAVGKQEIVVANLGDSQAFMISKKTSEITPLNGLLNADNEHERNRIMEKYADKARIECNGRCYVFVGSHGLQPTRTVGDKSFDPVIQADPELTKFRIPEHGARIILSSDGLWDQTKPEDAAEIAMAYKNPKDAAIKLMETGQDQVVQRIQGWGYHQFRRDDLCLALGHGTRNLIDDMTIIVFDVFPPTDDRNYL